MAFNISYIITATDKFSSVANAVGSSMKKITGNAAKLNMALAANTQRIQGLKAASAGLQAEMLGAAAGLMAVAFPVKEAVSFENAMSDVRKVVDFSGKKDFDNMTQSIMGLARALPLTQNKIASLIAQAAQFGVAKKDLTSFTDIAGKMAVAFDMPVDVAAKSMASLRNIFGLTIPQVKELGDAMNYFSNRAAAPANDLVNIVLRTGAVGKSFGLTKEATVGLAGAFLQMGIQPERASTAILAMLNSLQGMVKATPEAQAAFKELGLSPKKFVDLIHTDAVGALKKLSEAYSSMDPKKIAMINQSIFGQGLQSANIMTAISNSDKFSQAMDLVASKTSMVGSMQQEFEQKMLTTSAVLEILGNSVRAVSIAIGNTMTGDIRNIAKVLTSMFFGLQTIIFKFPVITGLVFKFIAGLAFLRVAMLVGKFMFIQLKIAALLLYRGFLLLPRALAMARTAMILFNTVLIANPIGMITAAIALLIAGMLYLYRNTKPVSDLLTAAWSGFIRIAQSLYAVVRPIIKLFADIMNALFGVSSGTKEATASTSALGDAFGSLLGVSTTVFNAIVTVVTFALKVVAGVVQFYVDSLRATFGWIMDTAKSIGGFVSGIFGDDEKLGNAAVKANIAHSINSADLNSKTTVDINLKGNTAVVGGVASKSTGASNINIGQNMAVSGY